jgi:hypothetical protein
VLMEGSVRRIVMLWVSIQLVCPSTPAAAEFNWSGVDRIVAVGDIHGDYDQYIALLRSAGVINKGSNWSGGNTHLVQLGDITDRGPSPRKIMDLLMKLEPQAERAGGMVHVLIGNHEAMNVYGDLRYTTPEEFKEFANDRSSDVRQSYYEQQVAQLKKQAEAAGRTFAADDEWRKKWESEHPLGWVEHRFAYGPNGKYARWIRALNVVSIINETLFVHGGIGPKYADIPAGLINDKVRQELSDFTLLNGGLAMDPEGPLWYRGLADGDEQELAGHVDSVLKNFGVRRIVIGHTPTLTAVIPRFAGKVVLADVGLSKYYGGPPACLLIEHGQPYALHRGNRLELPSGGVEGLLKYLRAAAAFDPQPSPITKVIEAMQKKLQPD